MSRRVQLAVGAYVRHQYTEYDALLKKVSWREARDLVQPVSFEKLLEWRDEGNDEEVEEIFQEIIVLDDEDDEDGEDDEDDEQHDDLDDNSRESSVEITSSRATGNELQPDLTTGPRSYAGNRLPYNPDSSSAQPPYSANSSAHPFPSTSVVRPRPITQQPPRSTALGRDLRQYVSYAI